MCNRLLINGNLRYSTAFHRSCLFKRGNLNEKSKRDGAQSVGILPNNGVALFSISCYTIGRLSSGGRMDLRIIVYIYRDDRTVPMIATPKQIIV